MTVKHGPPKEGRLVEKHYKYLHCYKLPIYMGNA